MKSYIVSIVLGVVGMASCSDDNSPNPAVPGTHSKIIGNYIYTILDGTDQEGAPGQYLDNDVKMMVTDYNGNVVQRNLRFTLSDESGAISSSYSYADTISVRWKLGCEELQQWIKVTDLNVCGLAQSGCIDVEVFQIQASATGEISRGWYEPCLDPISYDSRLFVNDNRLALLSSKVMISADDPLSGNWKHTLFPLSSNSGRFDMLSSGEIFYSVYYDKLLSSADGTSWRHIQIPYNDSNIDMEVTDNGIYFIIEKYGSYVHTSTDGGNWAPYLNITDVTAGMASRPQAMCVNKNKIFILTNGNIIIEIDTNNDATVIHEFDSETWPGYRSLFDFTIEVIDDQLFLFQHYYNEGLKVLDLSDNRASDTYTINGSVKLVKSMDKIYIVNSIPKIWEWNGAGFTEKVFPGIDNISTGSASSIGMYNGSPVTVYRSKLYYYNN